MKRMVAAQMAAHNHQVDGQMDFHKQTTVTQMNGFTYTCDANGNIIQKTIINGNISQSNDASLVTGPPNDISS